ncbi:ABC transporter ATP-binding protein, partial [Ralstonia pickettii]|uniref:ABC transporter ATP-binding protein n=1 Tax=Ralstonia pickettii TaxID=329 RepID=UPI002175972D
MHRQTTHMLEPNDTFVRIENVVKKFGDSTAVDNVNLTIAKNELFALLGSSGCGKSTLLRMLAGLETATSGKIFVDGEDLASLPPYRRPVNMMFQSYALFPHMTVESNVAFGLKQEGTPKNEIRERVADALALVQMSKYAKRKPHQLSGGQQQRVALARSLVKRPKLLLLDEPMSALDKQIRQRTQIELVNILNKVGVTCIMVTHDQEEALSMADRIVVMNHGVIEQIGTPLEIYRQPASPFVADFIGRVNTIPAEVAQDGTLRAGAVGLDCRHGTARPAQGAAVSVYVRPEDLRIRVPGETADNVLAGR